MAQARAPLPRPLPGWLMMVASAVIVAHLFCLLILALAAPSGPWPSPFGTTQSPPPKFAERLGEVTTHYYLAPLRMDFNYHYLSNRPDGPGVYFEALLRNADGELIETRRFPVPKENRWLRLRHELLAQGLADDELVQQQQGERIPAKGENPDMMTFWDSPPGETKMTLRTEPLHRVPKDRPISRPREWALLLARAYSRHLAQESGAASVQIVRYSRQPVYPFLLFTEQAPQGAYETLTAQFEVFRREK